MKFDGVVQYVKMLIYVTLVTVQGQDVDHQHKVIKETSHYARRKQQLDKTLLLKDMINMMCQQVPHRYAIGEFIYSQQVVDEEEPLINYITFQELQETLIKISNSLLDILCRDEHYGKVIICGKNSSNWLMCDLALSLSDMVSVPLHNQLSKDVVESVLTTIQPVAIFCDNDSYKWFSNDKTLSCCCNKRPVLINLQQDLSSHIWADYNFNDLMCNRTKDDQQDEVH